LAKAKTKLERDFQAGLKKDIRRRLPGCFIIKLDANEIQGIPDLLILFNDRWAILEVKRDAQAPFQPNQEWYIEQFDKMSFSSVIFPENKEVVLNALQQTLAPRGKARDIQREQVPLDKLRQRQIA
jgi:hypothetical protein